MVFREIESNKDASQQKLIISSKANRLYNLTQETFDPSKYIQISQDLIHALIKGRMEMDEGILVEGQRFGSNMITLARGDEEGTISIQEWVDNDINLPRPEREFVLYIDYDLNTLELTTIQASYPTYRKIGFIKKPAWKDIDIWEKPKETQLSKEETSTADSTSGSNLTMKVPRRQESSDGDSQNQTTTPD